MYDMFLTPGERIKSISKYGEELSLALKAKNKPIIKVVSEQGIVRLEFIDSGSSLISYLDGIDNFGIDANNSFPMYLGENMDGKKIITNMSLDIHTIVAGSTGSGKSNYLHLLIANSLIFNNIDMFLVDTKNIEFSIYKDIFKNISVSTTYKETCEVLKFLISEMEFRYQSMANKCVSDLKGLENKPKDILFIIDEFSDLILQDDSKELYNLLIKLTQKSRAARIFCVLATQRPSVSVINGMIKANMPSRVSFKVASNIDSRIILDASNGELLSGNGDAIIKNNNYNFERFQAAYVNPKEIIEFINNKKNITNKRKKENE
jgi:S-DNA-T family DNA segregation ATPase FtsK/SpoIIIE